MTLFSAILKLSGLSIREAAAFLSVRPDTVKSWSAGRNPVPAGVMDQMHGLLGKQEKAAGEGLALWEEKGCPAQMEFGGATDDHEARSLGWPSVGAQMAAFSRLWEMVHGECDIILSPRGSTMATAAAADEQEK